MPQLTSEVQYNTHEDGSVNQDLLVFGSIHGHSY